MKISELEKYSLAELNGLLDDVLAQIKTQMCEKGKADAKMEPTPSIAPTHPQDIRDGIIEKAKRDVANMLDLRGRKEFVVNRDKRTVVALGYTQFRYPIKVNSRGIAKCDPSDCFNVHIGKAIALRRALGLVVPAEYLNAPQPTEVRVGDVVIMQDDPITHIVDTDGCRFVSSPIHNIDISYATQFTQKIIDDSRDE